MAVNICNTTISKFDAIVRVLKAETAEAVAEPGWVSNLWKNQYKKSTTKVGKED
jgi:hypothetical protein